MVSGSSRTQCVISLSSCESELHSLVSTLCDGVCIRPCFEFVVGASIQHVLLTDSSSARRLVNRQGTGKLKHVDGKILWIQEHVRQGSVCTCQVSTVWNVADLRTKALAKQRVMLLLHEVGVHAEFGQRQVGQEEFDHQWSKHGEGRQLSKLAKAVTRIILVMCLEPTAGAEIFGNDGEQCDISASPDDAGEEHSWIFFWMLVLGLLWLGLVIAAVKFVQWTREELRQHAWQLADADRAYIEHQNSIDRTVEQMSALEGWVTGLEGQITMVSDYSESVRHGLVELSGFTRVTDLTAEERRGLYATERANLVARNAMGSNYYLRGTR